MDQRLSNILDPVHNTLDQDVFNGSKPKLGFFEYHLDHIREVFRQNNFNPYAFDFYLTGSLCTYQYSEKSDVDISIVCNTDEFTEEDRSELIKIVIDSLDGEFFPRTKHQYQHFVQPIGIDIEDLFILGLRSAWDFQKNKWVVKPRRSYIHNVSKERPEWMLMGIQTSDKINTLLDNNLYQEAKDFYQKIHEKRKKDQKDYGDYSEGNIIYKFLDNNGTFDRLRSIGQKIASSKESGVLGYELSNEDAYELFRSFSEDTHLNSFGFPCSCKFGKKNSKALKNYYKKLSSSSIELKDFQRTSFVEPDVKDTVENVISQQLNEESKWSRRYPEATRWFKENLGDADFTINSKNIKYFQGALNLYKKEVQKADPFRNNDKYAELIGISTGSIRLNPSEGQERNLKREIEKGILFSKEFFRQVWTNNYGKGIDPDVSFSEMWNQKKENQEFRNSRIIEYFIDKMDAIYNAIETYNFYLSENANRSAAKNYLIDAIDDSLTALSDLTKNLSEKENPVTLVKNMAFNNEINISYLSSIILLESFLKRELNTYTLGYVNFFKEYEENVSNLFLKDKNFYQTNPDKLFDGFIRDITKSHREQFVKFKRILSIIERQDLAELIKRYRINFPTNLNQYDSFSDLEESLKEILEEVREREEYRKLRESFDISDWDESEPVFTFEVRKGNPEKATPGIWGVWEVNTLSDLELEGRLMSHCIGNSETDHYQRRAQDLNKVYSVRDPYGIPFATLELNETGEYVGEAYGRHDHHIRPNEEKILNVFFGQKGFQEESGHWDRYLIKMANGEEKEWEALDLDDAIKKHNEWLNSWLVREDERKDFEAVGAYGGGHHWFSREIGDRSGSEWDYWLPDPEPEYREPYSVEESFEDYHGVSEFPSHITDFDELDQVLSWAQEIQDSTGIELYESRLYTGFDESADYAIEDFRTDEDGDPFYYVISNVYIQMTINEAVSILEKEINSILEMNEEQFENILDELEFEIKGFLVLIALLSYDKSYRLGLQRREPLLINIIDTYLSKKINEYKNNKNVIFFLTSVRLGLKSVEGDNLYGVDDAHSFTFDEVKEIGQPGSWKYENIFSDEEYDISEEEIEPIKPNNEDFEERKFNKNHMQYLISLLEEIKEEEDDKALLPAQKTLWGEEEGRNQGWPPVTDDRNKKFVEFSKLLSDYNSYVTNYRSIQLSDIDYSSLVIMHNKKNYSYLTSYLERERKLLEGKSSKTPEGQISFFDMPPEPTAEEYEGWVERQEGISSGPPVIPQSKEFTERAYSPNIFNKEQNNERFN